MKGARGKLKYNKIIFDEMRAIVSFDVFKTMGNPLLYVNNEWRWVVDQTDNLTSKTCDLVYFQTKENVFNQLKEEINAERK